MTDCHDPQSGEIKTPDGKMIMAWKVADCGKCPPCVDRRASRLWVELAEARSEFERIARELTAIGMVIIPL